MNREKHNVIAVIPARGKSKGIPLKNIAMLGNKALLEHTISHALKSKLLDRIIVSTDNEKIIKVAEKYKRNNVEIFKRPLYLSGDNTPTVSVLKHVLNRIKQEGRIMPQLVVTLQPTSPFRDSSTIDKAIRIVFKGKCDSVVALSNVTHSPYKMYVIKNGRLKKLFSSKRYINKNRQQLPAVYRESGTLYVTKSSLIINHNCIIGKRAAFFIVDKLQSIDIDEPLDLKIARRLYRR